MISEFGSDFLLACSIGKLPEIKDISVSSTFQQITSVFYDSENVFRQLPPPLPHNRKEYFTVQRKGKFKVQQKHFTPIVVECFREFKKWSPVVKSENRDLPPFARHTSCASPAKPISSASAPVVKTLKCLSLEWGSLFHKYTVRKACSSWLCVKSSRLNATLVIVRFAQMPFKERKRCCSCSCLQFDWKRQRHDMCSVMTC